MPIIFRIFPPFLIIFIVVFVIIPTIIAILLRRSLYRSLIESANKVSRLTTAQSRGQQPKIVDKLETRFKQASSNLEQVNTMALIDGLYSQEKLKFLGISFRYEQWDYFCKALPNLLLAFGLFGTFIGISYNLYNLSQTINQSATDVDNLVSQLQAPLQSMGIAFSTSLVAIACSSILIVVNLRCNTNFAKSCLISSLEDYLDNIFKVEVQGDTRLDKAVDRMVKQQQEFLERFHEKVGSVLETTIGKAANQMVTANQGFQNNVDSMVDRFNDISSAMVASTNRFQESTHSFENQVQTIGQTVPQFTSSAEQISASSALYVASAERIEASKFSENLEKLTTDLANSQQDFASSTAFLGDQVQLIGSTHQQATNLAEQVYTQLQTTSNNLQESSLAFIHASETFKESDFADRLTTATNELSMIPQQFKESTMNLHQSSGVLTMAIDQMNTSTTKTNNLTEQIARLNLHSSKLLENSDRNLQQEIKSLHNIHNQLANIVITLNNHKEKVNISIGDFAEKILKSFEQKTDNNNNQVQSLITTIETYIVNFQAISQQLSAITQLLEKNNFQS